MCELAGMGFRLDERAMATGLSGARWPGRLERIEWNGADVILDAAHNPAGAMVLAAHLRQIGWTGITAVVGVMRDKDVDRNAGRTPALLRQSHLHDAAEPARAAGREPGSNRKRPREASCRDSKHRLTGEAMRHACQPGARVVGAGSIFLIGPLRGILR